VNHFAVIAKIKSGQEDPLRRILKEVNDDPSNNPYVRLVSSQLTHFLRWTILTDKDNGPRLLLTSNYDGGIKTYVEELVSIGPGMDQIWNRCEGYSGKDRFLEFVTQHWYNTQAFYVGFPDESVQSIRRYIAIREHVEQFLDLDDVAHFLDRPGIQPFLTMLSGAAMQRSAWRTSEALAAATGAAIERIGRDALLRVFLPTAYAFSQIGQTSDFVRASANCGDRPPPRREIEHRVDTVKLNDGTVQNEMTTFTSIRPGRFIRLRLALVATSILSQFGYAPGEFADVGSLHSFSWVLVDNGTRLIFLSNFDGSWQNYMGDFVNKLVWGLDGLYNNTFGYPPAGMKDVVPFTHYILDHQIPPEVVYRAYPQETVLNIIRDRKIARMLTANLEPIALEKFLKLL
jgi:hypothetical protein